jgi:hypothetical protein
MYLCCQIIDFAASENLARKQCVQKVRRRLFIDFDPGATLRDFFWELTQQA